MVNCKRSRFAFFLLFGLLRKKNPGSGQCFGDFPKSEFFIGKRGSEASAYRTGAPLAGVLVFPVFVQFARLLVPCFWGEASAAVEKPASRARGIGAIQCENLSDIDGLSRSPRDSIGDGLR